MTGEELLITRRSCPLGRMTGQWRTCHGEVRHPWVPLTRARPMRGMRDAGQAASDDCRVETKFRVRRSPVQSGE